MTPVWRVPAPLATCEVALDDGSATIVRRYGNVRGRRLFLSHGNGLAIDLYYPFWSLLTDDFDVIVYDIRNHGRNPVGPVENHNMPMFVADMCRVLDAVDQRFGPKPRIGVYHSVSALVALLSLSSVITDTVAAEGAGFSDLVLFDPPVYHRDASGSEYAEVAESLIRRTRARSNAFAQLDDFVELLRYSPFFSKVVPGVHRLMAEATLTLDEAGAGYVLRCPPEYEARVVEYARSYGGAVDLANPPCRVKVVGADPTLPSAYLPTFDLEQMETVEYDFLPEATHYLQLEMPGTCVAELRKFLESNVQ